MSDEALPAVWEYREHALIVAPGISWEEWNGLWSSTERMQKSGNFWCGDVLLAGKREFGEQFSAVVDEKYIYQQAGPMWVCEKIPPERRRPLLSFSLHREVAALEPDEQDRWLSLAEEGRWTVKKLKEEREAEKTRASSYPSNGAPPPDSTWNPPDDEDEPEDEDDDTPVLLNSPVEDEAEAIRALINQVREMAPKFSPEIDVPAGIGNLDGRLAALFGKKWAGDPLRNTDRALLLRPAGWRIEMSESDKGWNVALRKSGAQIAIGIGPHLPCAIIEAVLSARIAG